MTSFLGKWSTNNDILCRLKTEFKNASPFQFIVIPDFFKEDLAEKICEVFPRPQGSNAEQWIKEGWNVYDNPIEGKLTIDDRQVMEQHNPIIIDVWNVLE